MPRKGKGTRKPEVAKLVDHLVTVHAQRAYAANSMRSMVRGDHRFLHSDEARDARHKAHPADQLRPPKAQWFSSQGRAPDVFEGAREALRNIFDRDREDDSDPFED